MNGPASRTLGRGLLVLLTALVLSLVVSSCTLLAGDGEPAARQTTSAQPAPREVVSAVQRTLDLRASGVRRQDRARFDRALAPGRPRFRAEQAQYFDNLSQLPLEVVELGFDPVDLLRVDDSYWVVVEVRLQLRGYDETPVVARDRYLFEPVGRRGRLRLASVTDEAWEERNGVVPQPWDRGPVQVREVAGVLGIFDDASAAAAPALLEAAQRAVVDVGAVVPFDWGERVVVIALSTTAALESVAALPGGDAAALDAVAVPVAADPRDPGSALASTRIVLHPRVLTSAGADRTSSEGRSRDRLLRHEVTHVAVGARDDDAPVWLAEGVAEWVSVRPLAPEDRALPEAALVAVREQLAAGRVSMPDDETFNVDGSTAHYGLSWWAVEHLAQSVGEQSLWALLEDVVDEESLEVLVGLDEDLLAQRAARLMVATYDD